MLKLIASHQRSTDELATHQELHCGDHTDLRVERTGQPVRFGVRASRSGAQNLDEEQIEDAGDHHRRSLRGRLHLE
jgi:hypothetical protein